MNKIIVLTGNAPEVENAYVEQLKNSPVFIESAIELQNTLLTPKYIGRWISMEKEPQLDASHTRIIRGTPKQVFTFTYSEARYGHGIILTGKNLWFVDNLTLESYAKTGVSAAMSAGIISRTSGFPQGRPLEMSFEGVELDRTAFERGEVYIDGVVQKSGEIYGSFELSVANRSRQSLLHVADMYARMLKN